MVSLKEDMQLLHGVLHPEVVAYDDAVVAVSKLEVMSNNGDGVEGSDAPSPIKVCLASAPTCHFVIEHARSVIAKRDAEMRSEVQASKVFTALESLERLMSNEGASASEIKDAADEAWAMIGKLPGENNVSGGGAKMSRAVGESRFEACTTRGAHAFMASRVKGALRLAVAWMEGSNENLDVKEVESVVDKFKGVMSKAALESVAAEEPAYEHCCRLVFQFASAVRRGAENKAVANVNIDDMSWVRTACGSEAFIISACDEGQLELTEVLADEGRAQNKFPEWSRWCPAFVRNLFGVLEARIKSSVKGKVAATGEQVASVLLRPEREIADACRDAKASIGALPPAYREGFYEVYLLVAAIATHKTTMQARQRPSPFSKSGIAQRDAAKSIDELEASLRCVQGRLEDLKDVFQRCSCCASSKRARLWSSRLAMPQHRQRSVCWLMHTRSSIRKWRKCRTRQLKRRLSCHTCCALGRSCTLCLRLATSVQQLLRRLLSVRRKIFQISTRLGSWKKRKRRARKS